MQGPFLGVAAGNHVFPTCIFATSGPLSSKLVGAFANCGTARGA
jgi:hypothetical protein